MCPTKGLLISLCLGVGSVALATDPPPPVSATTPATADAASTAPANKAAQDKAKSAVATATTTEGVTPEQAKMLRVAGYKADVRKGVTYYCRAQSQTGTRFETTVCGTPDDILRLVVSSQELVNRLQRSSFPGLPPR